MLNIWDAIKNYYITLGNNYEVDPLLFLGIHIVATPLFFLAVAWLIKNFKSKKPLGLPIFLAVLIFNAANIYLVLFGRNIPWFIYAILGLTTVISGYFSYKKILKKINAC
ncbi:MAG: hypothetical protein ACKVOW_01925 [Chitinophagaceae bacterium]